MIKRLLPSGGHLLDAGCGAGEWVAFLNENGYRAEGLDYSSELIARVRKMYQRYPWHVGSVQDLPFAEGTFDAIISWGVIEHDRGGPDRALQEFRRVLKPGGIIIVTVPVDTIRQRRASQVQYPDEGSTRHTFFQHFWTVEELAAFVRAAGLTVVESGLQRSVAGMLLWPELVSRLPLTARNAANRMARLVLWWHRGLMNMTYCVGRRTAEAKTPTS